MIGNSSSGIIEMPCFKKPTINVGKRQQGRLNLLVFWTPVIIQKNFKAIKVATTKSFRGN